MFGNQSSKFVVSNSSRLYIQNQGQLKMLVECYELANMCITNKFLDNNLHSSIEFQPHKPHLNSKCNTEYKIS